MKILTFLVGVAAGLALGLPFDIRAYTTTALSTLLNMIDDTTTKPSDLPEPADDHISSYVAPRNGQHALATGDDWLYRCDGVSHKQSLLQPAGNETLLTLTQLSSKQVPL